MASWLVIIILGFIEGLTEFIPVSSTGHLLIAEHWLPRQSDLFNVVIQCGAVLAVIPLFRERIAKMAHIHNPEGRDYLAKIIVAFVITGIGGVILKKLNFKLPEEMRPIAWALLIGGVLFLVAEAWIKDRKSINSITWTVAIAIGLAQLIAAIFPGASRSGSTILFALLLGTGRVAATEFSFLVGIPTMLAAGALEIHDALKSHEHESWGLVVLGTVVSALVSFVAVKWMLRFVQSHTFVSFGIYRIVLGILLLLFFLR
jgi:undecaprenyl-diphosphatase